MRKTKRLTALLLTVFMIVGIIAPMTLTASAATALQWPVPGHFALSRGYVTDHYAIDIRDSSINGANIVAAMGGTITRISKCTQQHYPYYDTCQGTGTGLTIKGTDGRLYSYAHMTAGSIPSSFVVGTKVNAGDYIGRVGTTGNSSAPHLHFVIANGPGRLENRIDPEYETYTNVGKTAFTFSSSNKLSASNTDAVIAVSLSKPANNRLVSYGATLYDNNGNVLGTTSAKSKGQKGEATVALYWTVSSSMGITLNPGRVYKFSFWANVSGVTLTSPTYNFTTTGTGTVGLSYPFSYNANGGSGSIAGSSVYYGSKVSIAANTFTREGYDFAGYYNVKRSDGKWYVSGSTTGWFTESEITANGYSKKQYKPGESYAVSDAWTGGATTQYSFTFYAQWTPKTYNILTYENYSAKNYMKDGGFLEELDTYFWNSRDTSVATVSVDTSVKHVSEYNTLKIVNSSAGASSGSKDLTFMSTTNGSATSQSEKGDSKEMILSFWAKSSKAGSKMYFRWGLESTSNYRSVTLTTDWAYYTVKMDKTIDFGRAIHPYVDSVGTVWISEIQLEDGTEATEFVNDTCVYEQTVVTYGETYSDLPVPEREGYTFNGWFTEKAGGWQITEDSSVLPYGMALYAHWTKDSEEYDSLTFGTNYANISSEGEMKYYTFTPDITKSYLMYSKGEEDTRIYVYDEDGNEIASDDDSGADYNFRLEYELEAGKTYTFAVSYLDSSTGTITFFFGDLSPLDLGTNTAVISTVGEYKYFTFTPDATKSYLMYSKGDEDTKIYVYDEDGNEIASDDDSGADYNFRLECELKAGKTYTFAVSYWDSSTGTITFFFGERDYLKNDVNFDGKVNMFDYVVVKSTYFKSNATDDEKTDADVNGDGKLNMFDYVAVKSACLSN